MAILLNPVKNAEDAAEIAHSRTSTMNGFYVSVKKTVTQVETTKGGEGMV